MKKIANYHYKESTGALPANKKGGPVWARLRYLLDYFPTV